MGSYREVVIIEARFQDKLRCPQNGNLKNDTNLGELNRNSAHIHPAGGTRPLCIFLDLWQAMVGLMQPISMVGLMQPIMTRRCKHFLNFCSRMLIFLVHGVMHIASGIPGPLRDGFDIVDARFVMGLTS